MRHAATLLALAVLTMILATACATSQARELQTESESVALRDAESVRANLKMTAGELKVGGDADGLMEADFAYNVADWQPKVSYDGSSDSNSLAYEPKPCFVVTPSLLTTCPFVSELMEFTAS